MSKKLTFHGVEIGEIDYDFDPFDPADNPDIPGYDLYERHLFLHQKGKDDPEIIEFCLERLALNLIETQQKDDLEFEEIKWWGKPQFIMGKPRLGWSARAKKKESDDSN